MEKFCKFCGAVFNDLKYKLCPYCGGELDTRYGGQPIPRKLRHEVFKRDGYKCKECGASKDETSLEIDHIVPVARGGTNDIDNLQTLCRECNRKKHTDTLVGGETDLELAQNELSNLRNLLQEAEDELYNLKNLLQEAEDELSNCTSEDEELDCRYSIVRLKESIEEIEQKINDLKEEEIIAKEKDKLFKELYIKIDKEFIHEIRDHFSLEYSSKEEIIRYLVDNYDDENTIEGIAPFIAIDKFKQLNVTTKSIYDLEGFESLIIFANGENSTNFLDDDIEEDDEYNDSIIFISEDFSNIEGLSGGHSGLKNLQVVVVLNFTNKIKRTIAMFSGCKNLLKIIGLENWDVSNVTNMKEMFYSCGRLNDFSELKNWDVSNVKSMESMFCQSGFTNSTSLEDWDVSNVTNMREMFCVCLNLLNVDGLANWDVSNVTNMREMFGYCKKLVDISALVNWDVSNVKDMSEMFYGCAELVDASVLSNWDVSNVKNMERMFDGCPKLEKYPSWYKPE